MDLLFALLFESHIIFLISGFYGYTVCTFALNRNTSNETEAEPMEDKHNEPFVFVVLIRIKYSVFICMYAVSVTAASLFIIFCWV